MKANIFTKSLAYTIILFSVGTTVSAQMTQKIGGNPFYMEPSAVLELESTTKGFLLPRMTSAQMLAIPSPPSGMMVYCTDCGSGIGELRVKYASSWGIPALNLSGDITAAVNAAGSNVTTIGASKVLSSMINDGEIVNADVNAAAAIAGTKISPDFGSQNVVTTGTLGAGATSLSTLSTSGAATLNSAAVTNNATVGGTLGVTGASSLTTLSTSGNATLNSATVTNNATVGGTLGITGTTTAAAINATNVAASGTLNVTGTTTASIINATNVEASGSAIVYGATSLYGGLSVEGSKFTVADGTGNTAIEGTLGVTGATTVAGSTNLNGGLTMDTNKFTVADTTGDTAIAGTLGVTGATTVTGATNLNGGLTMDTDKFTVADTTGNTAIAGTLGVTGATTLGNVSVTGTASIQALAVTGTASLNAGFTVDSNKFTVQDNTGNTAIAGTLDVTGATNLNGGLTMDTNKFTVADTTGNTAIAGTLGVTGATTVTALTASGAVDLGTDAIQAGELSAGAVATSEILNGTILNEDVDAAAAIAGTKISPNFGSQNVVTTGTLGAGATSLTTLSTSGAATLNSVAVTNSATVGGTLGITGTTTAAAINATNVAASGTLGVTGATSLSTLSTSGAATLNSAAVTNNATVGGTLGITGTTTAAAINATNVAASGTLGVTGATTLSTLSTSGAATLNSAAVTNNATVGGTLGVTGATTVTGATNLNGGLTMDTNKFTVADTTGDTAIAGTLGVTGATSLSTVSTSGAATLNSAAVTNNATVGGTLGVTGATSLSTVSTSGAATLNSAAVTNNATVGGTLGVTGVATFTAQPILSSLTASRAVFTDGSKGLVSNAITGTGDVVMSTSPTLVTPTLGVATATSVNGTAIPSSKTLVVTTDKLSALAATTSAELAGVISDETGTGSVVLSASPVLTGTPTLPTGTIGVTQTAGDNTTKLATTAFVTGAVVTSLDGLSDAKVGGTGFTDSMIIGHQTTGNIAGSGASFNTGVGTGALQAISNGGYANTATGYESLAGLSSGQYNTAFGYQALKAVTSTLDNTAFGSQSLKMNTGTANTAIGNLSLLTNTTGNNNTAIGASADVSSSGLTNATAIGYEAKVATSNTIQLGDLNITNVKTSGTLTADAVTYPKAHGTNGQVLSTTGSGTLAWTTSVNGTAIPSSKTLVVTTDKLSALAATTSAELAGVISDETGSGAAVFASSPTLVTPTLGVATATTVTTTNLVAGTNTYPTDRGTNGQVLLTNGSGALSWGAAAPTLTEITNEYTAIPAVVNKYILTNTAAASCVVKMYINGVRISNSACVVDAGKGFITYTPANNGSYVILAGDRVQLDYSY